MGRFAIAFAALGVSVIWASAAEGELYVYADDRGAVHVVSELSQVPIASRAAALADAERRSGGTLQIVDAAAERPAVSAPPPASPGETPIAAAGPSEIAGRDSLWWRAEIRARRNALAGLAGQLEAAMDDEAELSNEVPRSSDDPGTENLEEAVAEAKRDLDDFEAMARGAGVPPAWLH